MMVITPPDYKEIIGPLVFLAGPIQGAPLWQNEAIRLISRISPVLHIANPRREYSPGGFAYDVQVDWESHHLRRASADGVILFWLAGEADHDCRRAYAQTTRFELAEWKVRHEHDGIKLVIGIDEGFTGAKYIRRRFAQDCPEVQLCNSIEETCRRAVEMCDLSVRTG